MNFKNMSEFCVAISYADEDKLKTPITTFIKPTGHLYMVRKEGDNTILSSKDREHYNDPISKELVSLGYEGVVTIESIGESDRPKSWLNQYLDSYENMPPELITFYENRIRVHVFSECKASAIYNIQITIGIDVALENIEEFNLVRGSTNSCDGVIFKLDGEWYQLLPRRGVQGIIRSVVEDGLIVFIPVDGKYRPILARWSGSTDPKQFIGKRAMVRYTKNLTSEHLNPILSPVVYEERIFN